MKSNEKEQFVSVICQHVDSVCKLWSFHIQMKIVSASDFKLWHFHSYYYFIFFNELKSIKIDTGN